MIVATPEISKFKNNADVVPNAIQKQWMQTVLSYANEFGNVVPGSGRTQIHHVVGRTYVQNKTPIGHWFILPMPAQLHDSGSNDPLNVTHYRHRFTDQYGKQTTLFKTMCLLIEAKGWHVPFSKTVWMNIEDTNY
ncbi:hypothetical protein [Marinicellulosiphila megalodicopiae]|uniref:hypothetical protein n=1 Tax=Marinicellulosiphila megalodicopiae TaxID=2724896 RepID=UPI003BB03058